VYLFDEYFKLTNTNTNINTNNSPTYYVMVGYSARLGKKVFCLTTQKFCQTNKKNNPELVNCITCDKLICYDTFNDLFSKINYDSVHCEDCHKKIQKKSYKLFEETCKIIFQSSKISNLYIMNMFTHYCESRFTKKEDYEQEEKFCEDFNKVYTKLINYINSYCNDNNIKINIYGTVVPNICVEITIMCYVCKNKIVHKIETQFPKLLEIFDEANLKNLESVHELCLDKINIVMSPKKNIKILDDNLNKNKVKKVEL
jgi:hypothetical protein